MQKRNYACLVWLGQGKGRSSCGFYSKKMDYSVTIMTLNSK